MGNFKKFKSILILFTTILNLNISFAGNCDELIKNILRDNSFASILTRTETTLKKALKDEPLPITSSIEERRKQVWTGLMGPQSLNSFFAKGVKFLKTPDPNTESFYLAMRKHPGTSALLHVDMPFKGLNTSTKVFAAKPIKTSKDTLPDGQYLIGPEFESVIWHIHGGGTPSAVAGNASSKANYYVKRGIPVLAVDQPGHGNGPTFPFVSDEEIFEWNYELMKQLIHPDVKIHLHGHSWGGMKTTSIWQKSTEGKFDRIVAFQAESPGADLSLGKGGPREKARLEKIVNDSMDDWEERAAPSDVEFTKNVVLNRKMSPVAQEYTYLTDVFYNWKELTPQEIGRRKRINVLVGTYDGLVYVGRESIYDKYYSTIAGPNYHKFTRGKTFKGNDIEQGHQIFDLVNDEGDFVAYRIGVDLVHEISGQDVSVREIEGNIEDPLSVINRYFNHYANNFAFREYLENHTEYVEVYNQTFSGMIQKSNSLKGYIMKLEKIESEFLANKQQWKDQALKNYAQKYGVTTRHEKAVRELSIEVSEQRTKELQQFVDQSTEVTAKIKDTYHDSQHEVAIREFSENVDKNLGSGAAEKVIAFEDYSDALRNVSALERKLKHVEEGSSDQQNVLATIERIYANIGVAEENRTTEFLTSQIKFFQGQPEGQKHNKWPSAFNRAVQDYKKLQKEYRRRLSDTIDNAIESLEKPSGIRNKAEAEWELTLDTSETRKQQLREYIAGYEDEIKRVEQQLIDDKQKSIDDLDRPTDVTTLEQAKEELEVLQSKINKRFIPEQTDPQFSQIKVVVEKLKMIDSELNPKNSKSIQAQLSKTNSNLARLKNERTVISKKLNILLERAQPSKALEEAMANYEKHLEVLIEVNTRYAEKQEEFYIQLFEEGRLTRENIANIPDNMRALAKEYEIALADADAAEARLSRIRLVEARLGKLTSDSDPEGEQVKNYLEALLGKYTPGEDSNSFAKDSLEGMLLENTKKANMLESKLYKLKEKEYELERIYKSYFVNDTHGNQDFYQVHEVNIKQLLDLPLEKLIDVLKGKEGKVNRQAFKKALTHWEDLWGRMNADDNFKRAEVYEL